MEVIYWHFASLFASSLLPRKDAKGVPLGAVVAGPPIEWMQWLDFWMNPTQSFSVVPSPHQLAEDVVAWCYVCLHDEDLVSLRFG